MNKQREKPPLSESHEITAGALLDRRDCIERRRGLERDYRRCLDRCVVYLPGARPQQRPHLLIPFVEGISLRTDDLSGGHGACWYDICMRAGTLKHFATCDSFVRVSSIHQLTWLSHKSRALKYFYIIHMGGGRYPHYFFFRFY